MNTSWLLFIELLLVFGVVFGLCARELLVLRRERKADVPSVESAPDEGGD
ncbi:MAG: hypothetical protein JJU27_09440 [Gammaproteobacteria bacterium]|nr:hypothetical protein [Gammaproteobacteria bacterium]